jgi:hypothetical protein
VIDNSKLTAGETSKLIVAHIREQDRRRSKVAAGAS